MPDALLVGYYGHANLGDEAMLAAIAADLRGRVPDLRLEVVTADPASTAAHYGVRPVPRRRVSALLGAIARADAVLVGGGSLLQDVTSLRNLAYYLGVIALSKLCGKPVMLYANGIGPVVSGVGRAWVRRIVNRVDRITVRDAESAQELTRLGVWRPPVEVAADPALGLEPRAADAQRPLSELGLADGGARPPLIGVSLRDWPGMARWLPALCDALAEFAPQVGAHVLVLPMQWPNDEQVAAPLLRRLGPVAVALRRRLTLAEAMGLVASCDVVLGMRLHAVVFAAMAGVPPVGLAYDPKVDSFLRSIGLPPAPAFDQPDAAAILRALRRAWEDRRGFARRVAPALSAQRERARRSAVLAAELLGAGRAALAAEREAAGRR